MLKRKAGAQHQYFKKFEKRKKNCIRVQVGGGGGGQGGVWNRIIHDLKSRILQRKKIPDPHRDITLHKVPAVMTQRGKCLPGRPTCGRTGRGRGPAQFPASCSTCASAHSWKKLRLNGGSHKIENLRRLYVFYFAALL